MRKPVGVIGAIAKRNQQKATYGATAILYKTIWGEAPKRRRSK